VHLVVNPLELLSVKHGSVQIRLHQGAAVLRRDIVKAVSLRCRFQMSRSAASARDSSLGRGCTPDRVQSVMTSGMLPARCSEMAIDPAIRTRPSLRFGFGSSDPRSFSSSTGRAVIHHIHGPLYSCRPSTALIFQGGSDRRQERRPQIFRRRARWQSADHALEAKLGISFIRSISNSHTLHAGVVNQPARVTFPILDAGLDW